MSKKFLLLIGLIFSLAIIFPITASAYCLWVPVDDCHQLELEDSYKWGKAGRTDYCDGANGQSDKRAEDKNCCCGTSDEEIGCCQEEKFAAFISNKAVCDKLGRTFSSPYPVFYPDNTAGTGHCVRNDSMCLWTLVTKCEDIGYWEDVSGNKCAGKIKREGSTAKCCCGKLVSKTSTSGGESTGTNPPLVGGSVRSGYKTLPNPLGSVAGSLADLPRIIGRVINALLSIIGAIALLIFVYGGFVWMTAAGNDTRVAQGKNILLWATIAIVIIFLSWMLVAFFFQALGV